MSSRPSFNKRRKEQARKEKQLLKAERKQQRKLEKDSGQAEGTPDLGAPDAGDAGVAVAEEGGMPVPEEGERL